MRLGRSAEKVCCCAMSLPIHIDSAPCAEDVRLLAELSHEIRTPLTALLGYVELMLDPPWPEATSAEKTREMLRIVQQSGLHVLDLVSSVLEWARLDAGGPPQLSPVSPAALCQEALAWLSPRVATTEIALRCLVQPSTPDVVLCDPGRLRQILLNVLGNALKFTVRGEVRLELSGFERDGSSWLSIEVHDTGIGMSDSQLANLFKSFSPGAHSASGAGLGLAISHRMCAALGGRLSAQRSQQNGSAFRIELPCGQSAVEDCRSAPLAMPLKETSSIRPLDGCHILLADDSSDTRRLISLVLRQAGASVTEALHGLDVCNIALAAELTFDLILLDIHMPICDGLTATRRLRAAGYLAPIVALTAAAHPEDSRLCLAAGCNGYATKPIERRTLIDTVYRWAVETPSAATHELVATATIGGGGSPPGLD